MSALKIYHESTPDQPPFQTTNPQMIKEKLNEVGVRFEQWATDLNIESTSSHEAISQAYDAEIKKLIATEGYQSWDIISLDSTNPNKDALRQKFLSEHIHHEDEVRFFVSGQGLFTLHIDDHVYCVLCERGDLISVPAKVLHWFDMGPNPNFTALRFFNNPEGWVAHYSGDAIADRFPTLA